MLVICCEGIHLACFILIFFHCDLQNMDNKKTSHSSSTVVKPKRHSELKETWSMEEAEQEELRRKIEEEKKLIKMR